MTKPSRWDRYLGMTAPMTQVPVPTATVTTTLRDIILHKRDDSFCVV